jgi:hypothetical protein
MPTQAVDEDGVNRNYATRVVLSRDKANPSKGCERVRSVRVTTGSMQEYAETEEAYTRCWAQTRLPLILRHG